MPSNAQFNTYGYTLYVRASTVDEADAIVDAVLDGRVVGGEVDVEAFRSDNVTRFAKTAGRKPY
jgi:hypothetical protein